MDYKINYQKWNEYPFLEPGLKEELAGLSDKEIEFTLVEEE